MFFYDIYIKYLYVFILYRIYYIRQNIIYLITISNVLTDISNYRLVLLQNYCTQMHITFISGAFLCYSASPQPSPAILKKGGCFNLDLDQRFIGKRDFLAVSEGRDLVILVKILLIYDFLFITFFCLSSYAIWKNCFTTHGRTRPFYFIFLYLRITPVKWYIFEKIVLEIITW